jgi:hypothetical protein
MYFRTLPVCYNTPFSAALSTAALIIGCGLSLLAIFKMFNLINILKAVIDTQPVLPLDRFDVPAIGTGTAIMRSSSDSSLSQRYMSPRDPPMPSYFKALSTPSGHHSEAFALKLPASLAQQEELLPSQK